MLGKYLENSSNLITGQPVSKYPTCFVAREKKTIVDANVRLRTNSSSFCYFMAHFYRLASFVGRFEWCVKLNGAFDGLRADRNEETKLNYSMSKSRGILQQRSEQWTSIVRAATAGRCKACGTASGCLRFAFFYQFRCFFAQFSLTNFKLPLKAE